MKNDKTKTGAQLLVATLKAHGADHVFCVPGESYLAVLDALYDESERVRVVACRHEGGAANMAEAYGKLTGRPGICMVTRGPGATNASIGVHTAFQDSTPMILFVGQVAREFAGREAFQEVDYKTMFSGMAKWVGQIESADRVIELVSRAFHVACAGRPGPVVLALPEDMLLELAGVSEIRSFTPVQAGPVEADMARMVKLLESAERPLVLLGGSGWNVDACNKLQQFAETNGLPVACAFRFQDLFDNEHENYIGDVGVGINPALAKRVGDADLLLAIGPRLGEMTTSGYTLLSSPVPKQKLVHVHAGAEELGSVYEGELLINSGMVRFAEALSKLPPLKGAMRWRALTEAARSDYLRWTSRVTIPGDVQMWELMEFLRDRLDDDAIITNGAGNYTVWVHRFYRYRGHRTQLAPTSGAMGYGVPAAIAAKIIHPDRQVVAFAGDGCFLMNGQEIATAVKERANVVIVVVNNGMYGTIRMHQEREYPGRVIATDLVNPDFAAFARSFGAHGETVTATDQFPAAFERAISSGKPSLIEVRTDPDAITPNTTITAMRRNIAGVTA
ncbi:thiamine pyrophosphate-binding protein [Acidovorax sp. JG5]|uniref:thiamine pyrophosphate-binding protein n=1 Tax=Acidovorax sp. JG5 TaxID=2822718 RepID=UPI001B340F0F|nr:thiamine pyrophosphate-binding protein [Acidovorax sp. JG5]MBP3982386.1 thiamine pyrophosphate-binding protein [Acidovorax sp. JG5]